MNETEINTRPVFYLVTKYVDGGVWLDIPVDADPADHFDEALDAVEFDDRGADYNVTIGES